MRAGQQALAGGLIVARNGYRVAASDIAMGIELLGACVRGAGLSIDGNLTALTDATYVARVRTEREQLGADSARDANRALAAVSAAP
jgi:formiminotetrahydrofolate cyclodeaminase